MARQTAWVLALVVACVPLTRAYAHERAGGTAVQAPQAGKDSKGKDRPQDPRPGDRERWKWWLYDRTELSITDRQSSEINQIFESTIPKLREARHELDRAEEELSRTIKEHTADLATMSILVDRVENARSQHAKMRVLMLYRMHLLLSPEQRTKLAVLRERQDRERRERERERDKDR
jgi:Spy/CpxP family protein refolding chaperone